MTGQTVVSSPTQVMPVDEAHDIPQDATQRFGSRGLPQCCFACDAGVNAAEPVTPAVTRSIRAARLLLSGRLHRQSVGVLTGRAAFPSHGLRSRSRLVGADRTASALAAASHAKRRWSLPLILKPPPPASVTER